MSDEAIVEDLEGRIAKLAKEVKTLRSTAILASFVIFVICGPFSSNLWTSSLHAGRVRAESLFVNKNSPAAETRYPYASVDPDGVSLWGEDKSLSLDAARGIFMSNQDKTLSMDPLRGICLWGDDGSFLLLDAKDGIRIRKGEATYTIGIKNGKLVTSGSDEKESSLEVGPLTKLGSKLSTEKR